MNWHQYFRYDAATGKLTWAIKKGKVKPGDNAGCLNKTTGYLVVRVNYKMYAVHRIVWGMFNPDCQFKPGDEIDHIDHDKLNNRLENLRRVNHQTNMRNQSMMRNNKSGVNGVFWDKRARKWRADIRVNGRNKYLGSFVDLESAANARRAAEIEHQYHENHGE